MFKWIQHSIPRFMYKYACWDRREIIQKRQIRFTQFQYLNDPFETTNLRHITEVQSEEWFQKQKLQYGSGYNPLGGFTPGKLVELALDRRNSELEREKYITDALDSLGILSLSTRPDNLLLWAHYAKSHFGIVIQFDMKESCFGEYAPLWWFRIHSGLFTPRGVSYSKQVPRITSVSPEKSLESIIFTKSKHWQSEQEWRICRPLAEADNFDKPFYAENSSEPIYLYSIPPSAIREVYFGCRVARKDIESYISTILADTDLKHVRFYTTQLDSEKFGLRFLNVY